MTFKLRDTLEPAFDGGLIDNKFITAGLFIVKNTAQRNNIGSLYRKLDGNTTTLCYVEGDQIYRLSTNPTTETTNDGDWEPIGTGTLAALEPLGTWHKDNNAPVLQDTDASANPSGFYIITGAPSPVDVTIAGLFGGVTTQVNDGWWVVSKNTAFFVAQSNTTWDALDRPQVIVDYENNIVISHTHVISDVTGLQAALDAKLGDSDVTASGALLTEVTNDKIPDVLFLKTNYHDKTTSYSQTEVDAIAAGLVQSVNTQTGVVSLDAENIPIDPIAGLIATHVQAALAEINTLATGNVSEAPIDGVIYGRKDGGWVSADAAYTIGSGIAGELAYFSNTKDITGTTELTVSGGVLIATAGVQYDAGGFVRFSNSAGAGSSASGSIRGQIGLSHNTRYGSFTTLVGFQTTDALGSNSYTIARGSDSVSKVVVGDNTEIIGNGVGDNYALTVSNTSTGEGLKLETAAATINNALRWDQGATIMWNVYSNPADEASMILYDGGVAGVTLNAAAGSTFASSLTADSLIKSGGLATEYLMADGSVSTLTNPVTGTGTDNQVALWNGTNAIDALAAGTDGHLLTMVAGAPQWAAGAYWLTDGDTELVGNGNTYNIDVSGNTLNIGETQAFAAGATFTSTGILVQADIGGSVYEGFDINTTSGITATGVVDYNDDKSGSFVARSLIDKGYADGAYLLANTTTNLTANTIVDGASGTYDFNLFNMDSITLSAANSVNITTGAGGVSLAFNDTAGTAKFLDNRSVGSKAGLEYNADYSTDAGFGDRSLIDKGYADTRIGGQNADALITTPTVTEDGYVIAWNNTNSEYELVAQTGGGVPEAPSDGVIYGRKDAGWVSADAAYWLNGGTTDLGVDSTNFVIAGGSTTDLARLVLSDATGTTGDRGVNLATVGSVGNLLATVGTNQTGGTRSAFITVIEGASGRKDIFLYSSNNSGILVQDTLDEQGFNYAADYSTSGIAQHGDRWIPDKGYNDSAYWGLTGTTNLSGTVNINLDVALSEDLIYTFTAGTGSSSITLDQGGIVLAKAGFPPGPDPLVKYGADYSGGYDDRTLIDKGYADGAYFNTSVDTNATAANVAIQTDTGATNSLFLTTDYQADFSYSYFGVTKGAIGNNNSGYAYIGSFEGTSTEGFVFYFDVTGNSGITGAVFSDNRSIGNRAGLQYNGDYSGDAAFGARSLIDKGYGDSHIGGQDADALITTPTITEDGYVIAWNNTNNEYELVAAGGGGWATTGTTTLTGAVTIDTAGNQPITFREEDATLNTILDVFKISRSTTGTATAGIGVSQVFEVENSTGSLVEALRIDAALDLVGASPRSGIGFYGLYGGVATQFLEFGGTGLNLVSASNQNISITSNDGLTITSQSKMIIRDNTNDIEFQNSSGQAIGGFSGNTFNFLGAGVTGATVNIAAGTTNAGLNLNAGLLSADPSSLSDGDLWYRNDTDQLLLRANGATVDLTAGGAGETYFADNYDGTAPSATGTDALAIGESAVAGGADMIAIGRGAGSGTGTRSTEIVALGTNAGTNANLGYRGIQIGNNADALGSESMVMGNNASSLGTGSVVFGGGSSSGNFDGQVVIGYSSSTTAQGAIGIGRDVTASATDGVAIGRTAEANAQGAIAIGFESGVNTTGLDGTYSISIGYESNAIATQAIGGDSIAIGRLSAAVDLYAIAIGYLAEADEQDMISIGRSAGSTTGTVVTNSGQISIGQQANAGTATLGASTVAIGRNVETSALEAIAIGREAISSGNGAIAFGTETNATANGAIMVGYHTSPITNNRTDSFALGWNEAVPSLWIEKGVTTTTDATANQTVKTISLDASSTYHISVVVVGGETDASPTEYASYKLEGTFYRNGSGTATQVGTTTTVHSGETTAGMDAQLNTSTNNVVVQVTGVATTNMNWRAVVTMTKVVST